METPQSLYGDTPSRLTAVVKNRFAYATEVVIILGIRPIMPVEGRGLPDSRGCSPDIRSALALDCDTLKVERLPQWLGEPGDSAVIPLA